MGSRDRDTSLIEFDMEITEIDVNAREKVLKLAQSKYLLFFNRSLIIPDNLMFYNITCNSGNNLIKLPFENIYVLFVAYLA